MKQIHKAGMVMALSLMAANAWADGTLDAVKKKGFVQCGVGDGLPGFSNPDAKEPGPGSTWTCAAPWPPRYWGRQQGQVCLPHRQGALYRPAVREVDLLAQQYHLDP